MEIKINTNQPMVGEAMMRNSPGLDRTALIRPVSKDEESGFRKVEKEGREEKRQSLTRKLAPDTIKEMVDETQSNLADLSIQVGFKIDQKTDDVVIQVFSRDTGELIREIPPEDLVRLNQKLVELRGVLFDDKA